MKRYYRIVFVISCLLSVLMVTGWVRADSLISGDLVGTTNICAPFKLAKDLANRAFSILVPVMVIMIMIAGIYRMMYGFEKKNLERSTKIITGSITGMLVVLLAWAIVTVYIGALGYMNLAKDWWNLTCPENTTTDIPWMNPDYTDTEYQGAPGSGGVGGGCPPNAGSCNASRCTYQAPGEDFAYQCQCNTNGTCNCDQFQYQAGQTLYTALQCMERELEVLNGGRAEKRTLPTYFSNILGVGDSCSRGGTFEECADPKRHDSSRCNHGVGQHYSCQGALGSSAIDLGNVNLEEDYYQVAMKCGATEFLGPVHCSPQDSALCKEHDNHVHIGFCPK